MEKCWILWWVKGKIGNKLVTEKIDKERQGMNGYNKSSCVSFSFCFCYCFNEENKHNHVLMVMV